MGIWGRDWAQLNRMAILHISFFLEERSRSLYKRNIQRKIPKKTLGVKKIKVCKFGLKMPCI